MADSLKISNGMKICIIIPAYNEEQTIGGLVKELKKNNFDTLVVNDGSTDSTASIAKEYGAYVISWRSNLGKGVALRAGFRFARDKGYDGVITMDGDGQHAVGDIQNFLKEAASQDADIIIGNRMGDISNMPVLRYIVNRVMSYILFFIVKQRIPDSQCGYRFISKRGLDSLRLSGCNYDIESEMLLEAAALHLRIQSVPIKTIYQGSASYIRPLKDTFRFIILLLRFFKSRTLAHEKQN